MKFIKKQPAIPAAPRAPKPPKARKSGKKSKPGDLSQKGGGKSKFVLLIGDEGSILVYIQGTKVIRRLFALSPQLDHTSAIRDLLSAHPSVPLYILADVIDQQYIRHNFPPVSAISVSKLVKRRIERDFQPEDITGFMRLGRDSTGRKEWQYLLIALGNTPLIQQWVDLLVELPNELKGIFLSPVEAQSYIPQLHAAVTDEKPLPWQLLVSHHKVSGFRQIVLKNGKLVFTRVTQAIDDSVSAVIAGNIEQEIINTLEYLRRLGFNENNSIEMLVIASQDVKETLDLRRFSAGQSYVLTPLEISDALGFEQAALSADRFGDVVMAAAFAHSKKQHLKLHTAYSSKLAQLYSARVAVKAIGALVALGLLGMCAMNLLDTFSARSEAAKSDEQRRPIQAQLTSVRKALSSMNNDVAFKSAVMLTYDAYMKNKRMPIEFINELAPYLSSQTRVTKFTWGNPADVQASGTAGGASTAAAPAVASAPEGELEMRVEMEITGAFSDTDAMAVYVDNYVANLKQVLTNYDISNLPYPWENSTPSNLEISFNQTAVAEEAMKEGDNRITLVFRGPKTATARQVAPAESGLPMRMPMSMPGGTP